MARATPTALRKALIRFLRAYEGLDADFTDERLWGAYEDARALLGDPVKTYPGGYENHHIHPYCWAPEDGCDVCFDYAEEQG